MTESITPEPIQEPVSVDDNSSSLTVDGTVTANLSATDNAVLDDIAADTNSLAVVGGGVEATALRVTVASDSTGVLSVDDNGGALTVDGTVTADAGTGPWPVTDNGGALTVDWAGTAPPIGAGLEATALRVTVATDSTGVLSVDDNGGALTVDGTVAVSSLPASTNTIEVVGDIAHDTGVSGNPVQVAGAAQNMDDTAPPNRVSAESDTTRLATDWDGAVFAHPHGPQIWSYHLDTSTAQTDTSVHAATGSASLCLYVTDIVFSSGAATAINLFFEEGASKVLGPYYLEAVAGRGMSIHFQTPKKLTANTALTLTTSAAIAHSVDVTGFVGVV